MSQYPAEMVMLERSSCDDDELLEEKDEIELEEGKEDI